MHIIEDKEVAEVLEINLLEVIVSFSVLSDINFPIYIITAMRWV